MALALALPACKGPARSPAATPAPGGSQARSDAGAPAAASLQLTPAKVAAFVQLQRRELQLDARELQGMRGVPDSGLSSAQALELMGLLRAHQSEDAAARAASGLRPDEIHLLDQLAADVIAKRAFAKSFALGPQLARLEALKERLPPEQRSSLDRTLSSLKAEEEALTGLSEERQKYGSRNVDLVLGQEAALTENYNRALRLMGGKELP